MDTSHARCHSKKNQGYIHRKNLKYSRKYSKIILIFMVNPTINLMSESYN